MNITQDEAIVIYARACIKWFGKKALLKVHERSEQLAKKGDAEGAVVRRAVCQRIEMLELKEVSTSLGTEKLGL